ncbi:PAAR domain-containing protein [Burkholderia sp. THE68]|uniref:PAAR domain-containing protein n=1 Tax=Burkholderia sp. THE68 TaxID=758782 RepID=UPI00256FF4CB|nr:PAAR domain-containing protein [Burkholderia sp. THE68]
MRKAAVRDGDSTTTGGRVFASGSRINDKGKRVALDGNDATCGNCEGVFKILGTGRNVSNAGRNVVLDGDEILCPCGKNRAIVGSNPGVWLKRAGPQIPETLAESGMSDGKKHGSWVRVRDSETGEPLSGRPFIARVAGIEQFGTTDALGYARIETDDEQAVQIHVVFSSPRRALNPTRGD